MALNPFKKVLIVNRGEIALRIIHALKEMEILSAVVYSPADGDSLAVEMADEAYALEGEEIGETYLNSEQILRLAQENKIDAIHPGYGFLSENADFAEACEKAGVIFIGPKPKTIRQLGDKVISKEMAEAAQVPTIPGYHGEMPEGKKLEALAKKIGFPLLIKAAAGGGGKGMRVVRQAGELPEALQAAARESQAAFGNPRVFLEKYLEEPRHIEIQILGDGQGNLIHLFERECSLQRRHQKIIEESPSPSISESTRSGLAQAALRLAQHVGYISAGTVEFIVDPQDNFYFLEVNTRLQVEHPVTEMVTGVDLVKEQIHIAQGQAIGLKQEDVVQMGHAIECRLYAEDPENNFLPSEGRVGILREPHRPGVRIDSGLKEGQELQSIYDPMLAKLCVHGATRQEALIKIAALLRDYVLLGVSHNLDFLRFLTQTQVFQKGRYHTHSVAGLLTEFIEMRVHNLPGEAWLVAALASREAVAKPSGSVEVTDPLEALAGFRNS